MDKGILYVAIILVLMFPAQVFGQVVFSEVMYDLEGSDSGREWVEIFNSGPNVVSLLGWKFYEYGVNHGLALEQGDESFESGEYAVIVSNPNKFLLDWPQFSGTLFDSSFSLSNTGETLIIRDNELVDIDSVTYSSELGASGDGNSLHYTGENWSAGTPTPGSGILSVSQPISQEEQQGNQQESGQENGSTPPGGSSFPVKQQISAFAGDDRIVTVGADSLFNGEAVGIIGEKLKHARFVWNFGDGARKEGSSVLHYYRYPGEYVVVLEVSSGEYAASDRIKVSVREAKVVISRGTSEVITIANLDEYELNLSWWFVVADGVYFMLPRHTIILPKHEINLSSDITGLHPVSSEDVTLQYPNGETVALHLLGYEKPQFENIPIQVNSGSYSQQSIIGTEVPITYNNVDGAEGVAEIREEDEHSSQTTSVAESIKIEDKNMYIYWFALIGMVVFGSISAIVLRRQSQDKITIIE